MLPPTIFFLVTFSIILMIRKFMNFQHDFSITNAVLAVVSALIMGKSILIADHLRLINVFNNKTLFYRLLWKVSIYLILASFLQYLEEVIPLIKKMGSFGAASNHYFTEMNWYKFTAIHILLAVFLGLYVFILEIKSAIGAKEFKHIIFEK